MDEFTADTFINHDESAPVVAMPDNDDDNGGGGGGELAKSEEHKSKLSHAGSKIKNKFHDAVAGKNLSKNSLQDRIFTK